MDYFNFRADSLAWNFHKMVSAPLQCSALLIREKVSAGDKESFY